MFLAIGMFILSILHLFYTLSIKLNLSTMFLYQIKTYAISYKTCRMNLMCYYKNPKYNSNHKYINLLFKHNIKDDNSNKVL